MCMIVILANTILNVVATFRKCIKNAWIISFQTIYCHYLYEMTAHVDRCKIYWYKSLFIVVVLLWYCPGLFIHAYSGNVEFRSVGDWTQKAEWGYLVISILISVWKIFKLLSRKSLQNETALYIKGDILSFYKLLVRCNTEF